MGLMLLHPGVLLLLLPLAAVGLRALRHGQRSGWRHHLAPAVAAALQAMGRLEAAPPGRRAAWQRLAPVLLAGLLVLALAGPARLAPGAEGQDRVDPILLLLDLSPSVSRGPALADAQAAAAAVLAQAGGRPVGLVLFAADAYLASAPTSDPASLQGLIAVLGPETMPVAGSRPDIALSTSRGLLAPQGAAGADLLMISDGGGLAETDAARAAALREAGRLAAEGSRLWALSLDAPAPAEAPPGTTAPQALAALARAGGGEAAPAAAPRALLARMAESRRARLAASPYAPLLRQDFGRWLLLLALLPALALCRARHEEAA